MTQLGEARAARNDGTYDRALRLYRCVPPEDRPLAQSEAFNSLLELASCRCVVDDLMRELRWDPTRYHGLAHLDAAVLERVDANGLREALVGFRAGPAAAEFARALAAAELADTSFSEAELVRRLEQRGIAVAGGVRLAVAHAYARAGELDLAVAELKAVVLEAAAEIAAWCELTEAALAGGGTTDAMAYAPFAVQLRRNRANLSGNCPEVFLRYAGYHIFFGAGMFGAVRPNPLDRPYAGNSRILRAWHRFRRRRCRWLTLEGARQLAQIVFLWQAPDVVVARSERLVELLAVLDRWVRRRQVRRACLRWVRGIG
ncbi:MAG TPA: hypothetical protein VMB84_06705 [Stellaceae bacterium]|nr:hypothetical protein [Stellaceae bacterium]